jgi:hypothetical protein
MPLWARQERLKLAWPALEFMQKKREATSDELEHHLLGFTTSTQDEREQTYEGGLTVWRNLVSWIVLTSPGLGAARSSLWKKKCRGQAVEQWAGIA